MQDSSIKHDFLSRTINVPSFAVLASRRVSSYEISERDMFQKLRGSTVAMSNRECLHAFTNQVVMNFRDFYSSSFLPIFINSQGVESSMKDTVNCKKMVVEKLLHQS